MANVSKKENESMSIEYSDNNNTIIDNIEAIQKIDNDYYNNIIIIKALKLYILN